MDVICLDEDDEIQQLQKELSDLQKERERFAKELKKRHLRNEIEKLRNENLQLKTKLIEHASQAHAENDNDVKSVEAGSQGNGQDKSIKKPTGSPGSVQDKGIKKLTESPGSGQDQDIKKNTESPVETGNRRPVGRPRKRPPSQDEATKSLPEIEMEPGNMSISMNSKKVKLLPRQEDIDCEDNEDNYNTLRENYIWNRNGSPQYLCSLCDFTCQYYTTVTNHLRKEHNKTCKGPNPNNNPGGKSESFESGNLSKRPPTRSSTLQQASDYSVEERQKSSDSAVKQTFGHSHKEICRPSKSAVKCVSEEKQPSSSSAFRGVFDNSHEERRKSIISVRRTSDHSNKEIQKSSGIGVRQTSEEKQRSSGSAVRQTSNRMREERQKTSDRATAVKSEEAKRSKANNSIADLFKQTSKGYECTVCQEVYYSYTVAYHHVVKHHAQPRYQCKYCAYTVYERHKLTKHCKIEHKGRKMAFIELDDEHQKNKSHTVEDGDSDVIVLDANADDSDTGNKDPSDCESDDNNNSDDESEEKSVDDKSKHGSIKDKILKTSRGFKCLVCGHQTISYTGLYKHYVTNHKEKKETQYKCSYCRYATNQRRYCIIHMKKAHKGKPIIYRTVGDDQKAHKSDAAAHASQQVAITDYISRTAKGFKCTLCGNRNEEYRKARYHVCYQHFAVFVCPYCEYKSSNRPQVVAHGKKLHPGKRLKIKWHVKGKTRKNNLSVQFGDAKENRKKNNSSDEMGNKRPVGRPKKVSSSPCVTKYSLPEIKRTPGYMSISMNSKRVKLLPHQEDIEDKKHHFKKEVSIKANDEVSIKVEPNGLEQSDVRFLPKVYIDKDELCEFVPHVNEPVIDGPLGEQQMPVLSCTTFVEEDPVPVSSTTVDVTPNDVDRVRDDVTPDDVDGVRDDVAPDEVDSVRGDVTPDDVDGVRDDVTPDDVDGVRDDVTPDDVDGVRGDVTPDEVDGVRGDATPDEVDGVREDVMPDKVDMAIEVTPNKKDLAREDTTPDMVDMARDVTPDKMDIASEDGTVDHPAGKSDKEKDSKYGNTEKKKDDREDTNEILSPRICMHIDQNEVWEIRVDELQAQPDVESELHQAKIKIENEEEAAGI
ncbi:hypothetical protein ACJMK2_012597 [Sinanodonta woodiana]|uniref:C2H2-type domain-containing protein n=1 Tax=Sinanodonta woodiana TaxID=1069815 RepID=A0ABD3V8P9_SINWO